ncbi:MAG: glycosyltransferase family 39 protein [Candidatus Hydrogenedentes bacterium]|nr:glycosyltransferase family 39 protein [Candidatus Hydrogenedentota bacterium]
MFGERDEIKKPIWFDLMIISFWGLIIFGVNIGGYDLWSPDEPRYAEVAREMMASGDYLVPRVNGIPYLEKPPLFMWCIVLFSTPFGDVTEVSARLPSLFSGIATSILVYLLAKNLFNRRTAWLSAIIFITMQRVWWQARFGQIDMLLSFLLTLSLYAFYRWERELKESNERKLGWLITFYVSIAGALFSKGLGTLVFPVLFLITYLAMEKRTILWRRQRLEGGAIATVQEKKYILAKMLLIEMKPLQGLLIVALPYTIWYMYARWTGSTELNVETTQVVGSDLFKQTLGRFLLGVSHPQPPWYYFITVPVDMFPWSLFLLWIIPFVWKNKGSDSNIRFLLYWIVPAFVFFSIAIGKRAVYLLPIFPTIAILTAYSLENFDDDSISTPRWRNLQRLLWLITLISLALIPHGVILSAFAKIWNPSWLLLSIVGTIAIVDTIIAYYKKSSSSRSLLIQIPQHASIYFVIIGLVVMPSVNQIKSVRQFCEPLRKLAEENRYYEAYSFGFEEEEYTFYAKHFIVPFLGERDLDRIIVRSNIPYKKLEIVTKIHREFKKAVEKVPISNLGKLTDTELNALRLALDSVKNSVDTEETKNLLSQLESLLQAKLNDLYNKLTSESPIFLLIREEDLRWALAFKPELATTLNLINTRAELNKTLYLMANSKAFALIHSPHR